jgi:hypothetical protein
MIEINGVLGIGQELFKVLDPVWHIGKHKKLEVQELLQLTRVKVTGLLQELLEVNDLVIAPVPYIGPGVLRIGTLPVDSLPGNPVGVVTIGRGGIQKLGKDSLQEFREAQVQGFPILENIPPVALVAQFVGTVFVPDLDGKLVPGPAGVAVPPAEGQRQVFHAQPFQTGPVLGSDPLKQCRIGQLFGQGKQGLPVVFQNPGIALAQVVHQVPSFNQVVFRIHASAHDVVQGIGKVPCAVQLILSQLHSVGAGHHPDQLTCPLLNFLIQYLFQCIIVPQEGIQVCYLGGILVDFHHLTPLIRFSGSQFKVSLHQVCPPGCPDIQLSSHFLTPQQRLPAGGRKEGS